MGCNNFQNEQTDALVEASIRGENSGFSPETLKRGMPAIHNDCVRCLEKNVERMSGDSSGKISTPEQLEGLLLDPAVLDKDLEILDLNLWPDHESIDEIVRVGEGLGMSEADIIFTPPIVGTLGVDNMSEKIRDMMWVLHTSKLSHDFKDVNVSKVDKLMFVGYPKGGRAEGYGTAAEVSFKSGLTVIHIFQNEAGVFPTRIELKGFIAHELFDANQDKVNQIIDGHRPEWQIACLTQDLTGLPPSIYAIREDVSERDRRGEYAAECCRLWDTDSPKLCREMVRFFDEYFS